VITPTKNALEQAKIEAYLDLKQKSPNQEQKYKQLISKISKPKVRLQPGDMTKINNAVTGYIENFFENNIDEMYKYLHPDLAKRGMSKKRGEETLFFQNMTNTELKAMMGKKKPLKCNG